MPFASKTSACFSVALVALVVAICVILMQWAEKASSPRQNSLKGSIDATSTEMAFSNSETRSSTGVCLVSLIDVEIDDGEERTPEEEEEVEEMLVCNQVSAKYNSGVSDSIFYIRNLNKDTVVSNQAALRNNEWFIEFSKDWIQQGRNDMATISIPDREQVQTIEPSLVPHHHSIEPSHRRQLDSTLHERRRRLTRVSGNRTVVVVAVDLAISDSLIYDHFFGRNNSLVTQMASCSQNQVNILPHSQHPIIKVSPKNHVSQYTFVDLYSNILSDIKKQLGLKNGESVTDYTDHLFLVVPDEIDRRPGELGWGATPGFFAGTVESLSVSRSTMTLLHEMGHNFGLGHAYEDKVAYSDMSTVMGYSHRNVVKMCFNGHNMWALGWMSDRSYEIQLGSGNDATDIFDLAFYGDYNKTTVQQPVIARFRDAYFTFNRRRDMNLQTKEYADMLLIVQELPGEYHAHTNLEEALAVGDNYEMKFDNKDKDKIFVEVCSFTAGNFLTPDVLRVAVSRKQNNACQQDTRLVAQANNQMAAPAVTSTIDCSAGRTWVELSNPDFPSGSQVELCDNIGRDPGQFCTKTDQLSQSAVWSVCLFACPQSGCTASTSEESEECQNLYPSIRLETQDEYGETKYVTRQCRDLTVGFLSDREEECKKVDSISSLMVSDVCKVECPGTGCAD